MLSSLSFNTAVNVSGKEFILFGIKDIDHLSSPFSVVLIIIRIIRIMTVIDNFAVLFLESLNRRIQRNFLNVARFIGVSKFDINLMRAVTVRRSQNNIRALPKL